MQLENAVLVHYVWKSRLKNAIASKTSLDAAIVARDDCCEVGQWLYGEGGRPYRTTPQFTTLMDSHKAFHLEAGKVADLVNAGRFDEAASMVEGGTPFAATSLAVGMAAKALQALTL